jgi:hypothetical protein
MILNHVAQIFGCPFCREMWSEEENVVRCPECGVDLLPLHQLPPSAETVLEREADVEQTPEELKRRSLFDFGRGRGWLVLLGLLGLFGFWQPWFMLHKPDEFVLSGFRIARHFAGWVWAGAIGWFILVPLAFTRRTIASMRGVRGVCAVFSSMTMCEIVVLANVSPTSKVHVPIEFGWGWGLFFSAIVSVLGTIAALNFGGPLPRRPEHEDGSRLPPTRASESTEARGATRMSTKPRRSETLH